MKRKVYLGKLVLNWCPKCNIPVLDSTCNKCKGKTKKVDITPPGDIRPAFPYDIELINKTTLNQFNSKIIPNNNIVILNKAPYDDRMYEVIIDGAIIGAIRYELEKLDWIFIPRIIGAKILFANKANKKWVVVDNGAIKFILKGANVLAPGVEDADQDISSGDEVIVIGNSEVIATGRARMSGKEMIDNTHGLAVKVRWNKEKNSVVSGMPKSRVAPNWKEVVNANLQVLKKIEKKAHSFIKKVADNVNKPVSVSYSGGKDSLATLLLVKEVIKEFDVWFVDTGLEFPETLENVKKVVDKYNLNIKTISAEDAFWKNVDKFGMPSMESRWCCKICKLGPITQLIEKNYENGVLTFIGQRKYESAARASSEHIWKNPWIGNQVSASPIQNWTALHVWLYLFWKNAPYNKLYEKGYDRIGCWLCPSANLADFKNLHKTHKSLFLKLDNCLDKIGYKKEWKEFGFWRWSNPPKNYKDLAKKLNINLKPLPRPTSFSKANFTMVFGYRPCKIGGISAEGSFGVTLNLDKIQKSNFLKAIGKVYSMDGVLFVSQDSGSVQVYGSGNIVTRSDTEKSARKLMHYAKNSIIRAMCCTGCGICVGQCPKDAIVLEDNGTAKITQACIHCGKCLEVCPLLKF